PCFFLHHPRHPPTLHSFPTRRSSDLGEILQTEEGNEMKIHAIQTGTVAITTKWREAAGHGQLRLVNTLLDREWTEPLPIYAFAIDRKSTRLNSSHRTISYAVFCLKKK